MAKNLYLLIYIMAVQVLCAQPDSIRAHTNSGARANSGWRLKYSLGYNASNSQLVLTDSSVYFYPNAYTGDENGVYADKYEVYAWNIPQQAYANQIKVVYEYNTQGDRTRNTYLNWDSTQWINSRKYEYSYDGLGNNTQSSTFTWFANNWYEINREVITYNAQGYILSSIRMDTVGGTLTNTAQNIYTRDNSNRIQTSTVQNWVSGAWIYTYKYNYFFTGSATNYDSLHTSYWNNTAWGNPSVRQYVYYGLGGYISQQLQLNFITSTNTWRNTSKTDFLYDINGHETKESSYFWNTNTNTWRPSSETDISISASNKLLELISKNYNSQTAQLENYYRSVNTYDSNDLNDSYIQYTWANSSWDYLLRNNYFYEELATTGISEAENNMAAKAYPNPFLHNTIIEYNAANAGMQTINIVDLYGRTLFSNTAYAVAGKNSFLWNAQDANNTELPAGQYIVKIANPAQVQCFSIIKN